MHKRYSVDKIPENYAELFRLYGSFIAAEIRRANTLAVNFEDALQEVSMRLVAAQVIEKFQSASQAYTPTTMTGQEACTFLGISWSQWKARQWAFRKGYKVNGERRKGKWMPDPISGGATSRKGVFSFDDILRLSDDEGMAWRHRGPIMMPTKPVEPKPWQFTNYLARAVANHFKNFCRQMSRRWKDRPGDAVPTPAHRGGTNLPSFRTPEGAYDLAWEDSIRDPDAEEDMDSCVRLRGVLDVLAANGLDLRDALDRVMNHPNEDTNLSDEETIAKCLASGYTLAEAVQRSSLSSVRKATYIQVVSRLA